jgi:RNA polymerase sigma factor (sigma-70 family)
MRTELEETLTAEERVREIRAALASEDRATADRHFATLLQGSGQSTERWLRRVIAVTPALHNASAYQVSDDLRQELALHLWERIATRHEVAWEHVYWRALTYAQQHVATHYMMQTGYWVNKRTITPGRGVTSPLIEGDGTERAEAPDVLSAAELAGDVRAVVRRLPPRERAAVVLRYWQGMQERDIAGVLGCSSRTVRTLLRQARERLGPWYEGLPQEGAAAGARGL